MDETLFRFVVVRPAQEFSRAHLEGVFARSHNADVPETRLTTELVRFHAAGDRGGVIAASRRYIEAGPPDYIQELDQLVPLISQTDEWLRTHRDASGADFLAFIDAKAPAGLGQVVRAADYVRARQRAGDSLLALGLAKSPDRTASTNLKRAVRLFSLLERIEADRNSVMAPGALAQALTATVLLRRPPFPPPGLSAPTPTPPRRMPRFARAFRRLRNPGERGEPAAVGTTTAAVDALDRHERALAEVVRAVRRRPDGRAHITGCRASVRQVGAALPTPSAESEAARYAPV